SVTQSITLEEAGVALTVTGMNPAEMQNGTTVSATIFGTGFAAGATVGFSGGNGPTPTAWNVVFVDSNTITANVTAKNGGPPRDRYWDLTVTNPDGNKAVQENGLTVTP
ncbi:MAG: hypothetical protein ABFS30_17405, partial [Pseudomonadota bacterium]